MNSPSEKPKANITNSQSEGPMLPLFNLYVERIEKDHPHCKRDQILVASAILTAADTILRYADYTIKMAATPEEPKEQ